MGFPFDEATWNVVDGAMYMGAGGSMPAIFTWLSIAVCIVLLWSEKDARLNSWASEDKK